VIVGFDNLDTYQYVPRELELLYVKEEKLYPYFYDRYCNDLKEQVTDGWFFFLDDDDTLISPTILQQLADHLNGPHEAIICQMLRNGVPKPAENYIRKKVIREGKIGLPCLVLHSKHKEVGALDGEKSGDYRYIRYVTSLVHTKFITLPVVNAGTRGHGKMEPGDHSFQNIQK
jgi:hypothetical protein